MDKPNISTDNQPKGSARNLSDTLDRKNEAVAPGQRQWADDSTQDPNAPDDAASSPAGAPADR